MINIHIYIYFHILISTIVQKIPNRQFSHINCSSLPFLEINYYSTFQFRPLFTKGQGTFYMYALKNCCGRNWKTGKIIWKLCWDAQEQCLSGSILWRHICLLPWQRYWLADHKDLFLWNASIKSWISWIDSQNIIHIYLSIVIFLFWYYPKTLIRLQKERL